MTDSSSETGRPSRIRRLDETIAELLQSNTKIQRKLADQHRPKGGIRLRGVKPAAIKGYLELCLDRVTHLEHDIAVSLVGTTFPSALLELPFVWPLFFVHRNLKISDLMPDADFVNAFLRMIKRTYPRSVDEDAGFPENALRYVTDVHARVMFLVSVNILADDGYIEYCEEYLDPILSEAEEYITAGVACQAAAEFDADLDVTRRLARLTIKETASPITRNIATALKKLKDPTQVMGHNRGNGGKDQGGKNRGGGGGGGNGAGKKRQRQLPNSRRFNARHGDGNTNSAAGNASSGNKNASRNGN